jgi:hypothetical protein
MTQIKKKEDEQVDINIVNAKIAHQPNTNHIDTINNHITDAVGRGFAPQWVLEDTAKHLALRGVETGDENYIEMINHLTTQGGPLNGTSTLRNLGPNNYGRTLKGKTIMLKAMSDLRSKQNAEDRESAFKYNTQKTETEDLLKTEAQTLFMSPERTADPESWNVKLTKLMTKASNKGMAQIVSSSKTYIDSLNVEFREAKDPEVLAIVDKHIKYLSWEDIGDEDYEELLRGEGIHITPDQRTKIKAIVDGYKDWDKHPEIVSAIEEGEKVIDDLVTVLRDDNQYTGIQLSTNAGFLAGIRRQKKQVKNYIKNVLTDTYRSMKDVRPINQWEKEDRFTFIEKIKDYVKGMTNPEGKTNMDINDLFVEHPLPINVIDQQNFIKTKVAQLHNLESLGERATEEDKEELKNITELLDQIDKKGQGLRLKAKEDLKAIRTNRLVLQSSKDKEDVDINKTITKLLLEGGAQSKGFTKSSINTLLREKGIRLGTRGTEKVDTWIKNQIPAEETRVTKKVSEWYKMKLKSIFPGFLEGFLEGTLRFDTEKSMSKVPESAIQYVTSATEKARTLVEVQLEEAVKTNKKPYGLWSNKQVRDFTTKVDKLLKANNGPFNSKHLGILRGLRPQKDGTPSLNLIMINEEIDMLTAPDKKIVQLYDTYVNKGETKVKNMRQALLKKYEDNTKL